MARTVGVLITLTAIAAALTPAFYAVASLA